MRWLGDLEVDRAVNQVLTEHWGEGLAQLKFINHKGLTAVAVNYLVDLMKMIWTEGTRDDDASQVTLSDLIGFLYTGLQPSIADVTAILLEQSPPDSGIVALTMDVGGDGGKGPGGDRPADPGHLGPGALSPRPGVSLRGRGPAAQRLAAKTW